MQKLINQSFNKCMGECINEWRKEKGSTSWQQGDDSASQPSVMSHQWAVTTRDSVTSRDSVLIYVNIISNLENQLIFVKMHKNGIRN